MPITLEAGHKRVVPIALGIERKPPWLKKRLRWTSQLAATSQILSEPGLHTICVEAQCPNKPDCWGEGVATFLILGDRCTRRCGFCAVRFHPDGPPDPEEPARVAEAAGRLRLRHVVVTSVNRDDLSDDGAGHFAAVIRALRQLDPPPAVEVLTPDFRGKAVPLAMVVDSAPEVFAHNVETVPRLYRTVRPGSRFERSVALLRRVKSWASETVTKSGLMVGLGETREELREVLARLAETGVDIVTIGQYLRPSAQHLPVTRYVPPEEFDEYKAWGLAEGIGQVAAGPFVRSSYEASGDLAALLARRGCDAG
jgi:lipoic acid synthetase